MKPRTHDPHRLDVAAFAADAQRLAGEWPLAGMKRLQQAVPVDAPAGDVAVPWSAAGELRQSHGAEPQVWLRVEAGVRVWLECQRCLHPVEVALDVDRSFRFVAGEDVAARLDGDSDDDVLELTRTLDLHQLVEDELLLALPLVPRHEQCPVALPTRSGDAEAAAASANPFAALQAIKRR